MKKIFLLFLVLLSYLPNSFATHIVGGVISYECMGFNQSANTVSLRITLEVYRDNINGQAPFDNPAIIGVFGGSSPNSLVQTISMSNPVINQAPVDLGTPCGNLGVNTNSVGVERGIYTQTITLPYSPAGYWFSYQRCCRNNTINNLINPGAIGATYTIFVSGYAMQSCNNSPTFDDYPPIAICKDFPLTFNHAATDVDGDSLVYSFCHPYTGASSANPAPNPPSNPPYTNIPFGAGFSSAFPMPAAPAISIDPQTGLLTGIPTATGQYVVGVCVTEYDSNGVLLSTTLRDFQFNVFECESSVNAVIQADLIDPINPDLGYLIGECDNNTITFINQSAQNTPNAANLIFGYEWNFDLNNGSSATSTATNPTITFPGPDIYTGFLVVNPGDPYCTDTALISLEVFPPMSPAINVAIDSCNPALPPIQFTDLSTIGGTANIVQWDWDFGDGTTSTLQNPAHSFPNAGSYQVNLVLTDDNGCEDNIGMPVDWFPPAVPQFTVDDPSGCEPHEATFTHTSFPFLPSYTTTWDFGDGDSSFASPTVTHIYPDPGTYDVSLTHVSPWGCVSNLTIPNMITVFEGPDADYTYTYDSCVYEAVDFFDASTPNSAGDPIVSWFWDFQDGNTATGSTSSHLYQFAGTYPVDLVVTDINGCTDTIADSIQWYPKPVIDVTIASPFGCAPYSVFFDNQSYPINGYSTIWDFGDGNTDTVASPTHIYQNPGIYYVNLVITSPLGCTDTFRDTVEVWETPNADFSFNFDPCVIGPVSFDEFSTPNANGDALVDWTWDFDDGTILQAQDTSHQYNLAGDFDVSLIVTDVHGCKDTLTQTVSWFPAPIVAVDVSDSVGCQPMEVTFTNNSYPINGYQTTWDFGDGGTDTAASPTYTYMQHGTYQVHLFILSPTGCTGDFYDTIVVHENPTADFSYNYDICSFSGVDIQDLSSTNQAGDSLHTWNWDFDNNWSTSISYPLDSTIPYPPRDTYTVSMHVIDANGCSDTIVQEIPYFPAPVFPVNSHSVNGCVSLVVDFDNNDLNNYPGYTFFWDFGDSTTSTVFDTTYIYPNEGTYYPTLVVNTPSGCTETFRDTVVANGNPTAVFDMTYDPCSFDPVRFRNLSIPSLQGNLDSTLWNFGDGSTSSNPLAFHNYNYPDTGNYTVSLYVEDNNGCNDDSTATLYWRPQPVFPVDLEDSRGCVPHAAPLATTLFGNSYPYPANGYSTNWTYGNGQGSSEANPQIIYTNPGVYERQLVVQSPIGCIDSFRSTHTALEVPIAGFSFTPPNGQLHIYNPEVSFLDASINANQWWWDFGDETTVLMQNPTHTYVDTGYYLVSQIAQHLNGCTDTAEQIIDIAPRVSYFLPNAFTPNGNGKNDGYRGNGYLEYIQNFEMLIFNRWGEQIFSTNSPYEAWNGRKNNTGKKCQAGVYVVLVRYREPRGDRKEIKGFATIIY